MEYLPDLDIRPCRLKYKIYSLWKAFSEFEDVGNMGLRKKISLASVELRREKIGASCEYEGNHLSNWILLMWTQL